MRKTEKDCEKLSKSLAEKIKDVARTIPRVGMPTHTTTEPFELVGVNFYQFNKYIDSLTEPDNGMTIDTRQDSSSDGHDPVNLNDIEPDDLSFRKKKKNKESILDKVDPSIMSGCGGITERSPEASKTITEPERCTTCSYNDETCSMCRYCGSFNKWARYEKSKPKNAEKSCDTCKWEFQGQVRCKHYLKEGVCYMHKDKPKKIEPLDEPLSSYATAAFQDYLNEMANAINKINEVE